MKFSKQDEYFISIAKQRAHTFIMLGVMKEGHPNLLARVGKGCRTNGQENCLVSLAKTLGDGEVAMVYDEGLRRKKSSIKSIHYQAYTINYQQAKEFLVLISNLEKKQLENTKIRENLLSLAKRNETEEDVLNDYAFSCFVPHSETDADEVEFKFKKLKNSNLGAAKEAYEPIFEKAQKLQLSNTCRTTALNIIEAILGFTTNVSKYFFVAPKYCTTLEAGVPNKDSFYILPPPPLVTEGKVSEKHYLILKKLYQRIEEIPLLNPSSPKTRAKFDVLKKTYTEMIGENSLSATEFMAKILQHEANNQAVLYDAREPNFLNRFFSIPTTTARMFQEIKKILEKNVEQETDSKPSLS